MVPIWRLRKISEQKSLKKWFDEELEVTKKDSINEERDRVKKVFRYESDKIRLISKDLSTPKEIMSVFVGKGVAHQVGKKDTDIVTNDELDGSLDTNQKNIRVHLSNLRKIKYIESVEGGKNKLIYSKLPEILDYILKEKE